MLLEGKLANLNLPVILGFRALIKGFGYGPRVGFKVSIKLCSNEFFLTLGALHKWPHIGFIKKANPHITFLADKPLPPSLFSLLPLPHHFLADPSPHVISFMDFSKKFPKMDNFARKRGPKFFFRVAPRNFYLFINDVIQLVNPPSPSSLWVNFWLTLSPPPITFGHFSAYSPTSRLVNFLLTPSSLPKVTSFMDSPLITEISNIF